MRSVRVAAMLVICSVVPPGSWAPQAAAAAAPASAAPQAGATELEFWRSAERMGSPEAYRAYLAAYPQGAFAPLARAALGTAATPARAVSAATTALPPASPALRHFSVEARQTGAIVFKLGDRFIGPGVVEAGWAGAKKQLVLPPGEWVVLAAADFKSDQSPLVSRVPTTLIADMTTLVLGRFSGTRLAAAMVFVANVRPLTVPEWSDLAGCGRAATSGLFHEATQPTPLRSECLMLEAVAAPLAADTRAMKEARASLERLGAQVHGAALASTAATWENRRGYLAATRLDWPGLHLGAAADAASAWTKEAATADPARAAFVRGLIDWTRSYGRVVAEGYRYGIEQPLLKAGEAAAAPSALVREMDTGGAAAPTR